jgi:hypothetical protein
MAAELPVCWGDALDAIADRLVAIVSEYGGDAVLPYSYMGTQGIVQGEAVAAPFSLASA